MTGGGLALLRKMVPSATQAPKDVVILGGGIAGVMTAYFLTESSALPRGAKITIVENTAIAAGASGYSGGFLAKDWHGNATASLAAMSYDLHAKLAKEFGGEMEWGYRTVDTLSIETDDTAKSKGKAPLQWLTSNVVNSRTLGTKTTTAQVHPKLFTQYFFQKFSSSTKAQTSLVQGQATAIRGVQDGDKVTSVQIKVQGESEERSIPADAVVIAVGPWTGKVAKELLGGKIGGRLGVEGHRAHSIILKTKEELSAHCLFTSMTMKDGSMGEPEVYARPDGTTYICGAGDNEPLPETAADVRPSPSAVQKLHTQAHAISPVFNPGNADVKAEQACFLPIADRGRPLIGRVKGAEGVYVASGLSCWGITQGPGTGLCMAQLILEGKASAADISRLAP